MARTKKAKETKNHLTVRIVPSLISWLKSHAAKTDQSVGVLVGLAVEELRVRLEIEEYIRGSVARNYQYRTAGEVMDAVRTAGKLIYPPRKDDTPEEFITRATYDALRQWVDAGRDASYLQFVFSTEYYISSRAQNLDLFERAPAIPEPELTEVET